MSAEKLKELFTSITEGCEFNCECYLRTAVSIKCVARFYFKSAAGTHKSAQ
jgi:hypothetical protein